MSSVLDAMNKVESEQRCANTAADADLFKKTEEDGKQPCVWPYLLLTLVVGNILGWYVWNTLFEIDEPNNTAQIIDVQKPIVIQEIFQQPILNSEKTQSVVREELVSLSFEEDPSVVAAAIPEFKREVTLVVADDTPPPSEVLEYNALPASIRDALPSIDIAAHIFSEKRQMRAVMINGDMFHEQDYIDEQLLLESINQNHIVMNYRGFRFRVWVNV